MNPISFLASKLTSKLKEAALSQFQKDKTDENGNKKKSTNNQLKDLKDKYEKASKIIGFLASPGGIILIIVVVVIFALISGGGGGFSLGGGDNPTPAPGDGGQPSVPVIPGFNLEIDGPEEAENGIDLVYTVTISHNPSQAPALERIELYDALPSGAQFITTTGILKPDSTSPHIWSLSEAANQKTFTITIRPNKIDTFFEYTINARVIGGGGSGNLSEILPSTTFSANVDAQQQSVANLIKGLPASQIAAYQDAEAATGVPWQILAGLHYREGSLNGNNSLVSGRPIGTNEPDIVRGGGCSSGYTPGEPVALSGGGCGFRTFTDSVIYAANHYKGKNGGNPPASFMELTKSLSYYNGGGNSNCGKTPYTGCPPTQIGEDDAYVMTLFDAKHETMYIVYCADFTLCSPPRQDQRLGVASVIMALSRFY